MRKGILLFLLQSLILTFNNTFRHLFCGFRAILVSVVVHLQMEDVSGGGDEVIADVQL